MRKSIIIAVVFYCVMVLCMSLESFASDAAVDNAPLAKDSLKLMTVEELAKYDGKEGRAAYVAVDSVIYDVSTSKYWKNGEHKRGLKAGKDQSAMISKSPHGKKILNKVKVVGKLVPAEK